MQEEVCAGARATAPTELNDRLLCAASRLFVVVLLLCVCVRACVQIDRLRAELTSARREFAALKTEYAQVTEEGAREAEVRAYRQEITARARRVSRSLCVALVVCRARCVSR